MLNAIRSFFTPKTKTVAQPQYIRARFDAAQTTADNERHWANADSLSAVSANSAHVRRKLRDRSRYEIANNSYARGILDTLADYSIGSGPSLQLTYRGSDKSESIRAATQKVEVLFSNWAYARKLGEKLHAMHLALDGDGEAFGVLTTGRDTMHTPVSLDLRLYECDHFDLLNGGTWYEDDAGVRIGTHGEPTEYAFSPEHPGDLTGGLAVSQWINAEQVLHLFRKDRPGQLRGVPKTTPALPLFAMLRRFTLATVLAAESAANFAAVLSPETDSGCDVVPFEQILQDRGMFTTLPAGAVLSQLKAEHPNATYDEFIKAIMREIARCLGVPAVLALGDASKYNYSSGRLDLQAFNRQMEVERRLIIERGGLDPVFENWLTEAAMIDSFLPDGFVDLLPDLEWSWRWQGAGHVDRQKEASGQQIELANHTTTLSREYAKQGLDWETELRQRARELSRMSELGLSMAQAAPQANQTEDEEDSEDESNQD